MTLMNNVEPEKTSRDNCSLNAEIDDVFDETVENRVKTEKKKLENIENYDVFDEAFGENRKRNLCMPSLSSKVNPLIDDVSYDERNIDDIDDVFDEEREKREKRFVNNYIGFGIATTAIKLEVDEYNDTLYKENLREILGIKQENYVIYTQEEEINGFSNFALQNLINNSKDCLEVSNQDIKAELEKISVNEYESEKYAFITTQKSILERDLSLNDVENSVRCGETTGSQIKIEEKYVNINNEIAYAEGESWKEREKRSKTQLEKQHGDINVSENNFVDITEEEENLDNEVEVNSRNQSDKDNKQEENAESKETGNRSEVDSTTGGEDNLTMTVGELSSIFANNVITVKNTNSLKEHTCLQEIDRGVLLNEKRQSAPGKVSEEQIQHVDEQPLELSTPSVGTAETFHNGDGNVDNISLSEEHCDNAITETTQNVNEQNAEEQKYKQPLDRNKQITTDQLLRVCSNNAEVKKNKLVREFFEIRNIQIRKKQAIGKDRIGNVNNDALHAESCLLIPPKIRLSKGKENVSASQKNLPKEKTKRSSKKDRIRFKTVLSALIEKAKTKPRNNIEYYCTKCTFKTKRCAKFKKHLIKHGTEVSSGIISFLDLVKKKSHFEHGKKGTHNVIGEVPFESREQCAEESIINIASNDVQPKDDKKLENEDDRPITNENGDSNIDIAPDNIILPIDNTICEQSESNVLGTEKGATLPINKHKENRIVQIKDVQMSNKSSKVMVKPQIKKKVKADDKNCGVLNNKNSNVCESTETNTENGKEDNCMDTTNTESVLEISENRTIQIEGIQSRRPETDLESVNINESVEEPKEENNSVCGNNEAVVRNTETPLSLYETEEKVSMAEANANSIHENMENLITEKTQKQKLNTDEVKLEPEKSTKRKTAENISSSPKKIKLEIKGDKVYRCDECPYQSHKKKYFNGHKIIHSKDVIKCSLCNFTTNLQRNITSHMLVHLKPEEIKMHKCPHCPYQTKRRGDLPYHLILHKKPEEIQMFQCDKCSYQSKRKNNLRVHQLCHESLEEFPFFNCAVCSFKTKKKGILRSHMIIHQKADETIWYKCEQCPYTTRYKSGLTKHGLVHKKPDEIRTYDCPVCFYKAKHKSHLKSHSLIHKNPDEVEMHYCEHCSYKSMQRSNLLAHMLRHKRIEDINMKKCGHCQYETKLKCNLLKHIKRIHSS